MESMVEFVLCMADRYGLTYINPYMFIQEDLIKINL